MSGFELHRPALVTEATALPKIATTAAHVTDFYLELIS